MRKTFLVFVTLFTLLSVNASVFIHKIINNTKRALHIEYAVDTDIRVAHVPNGFSYPRNVDPTSAHCHAGIYQRKTDDKWSVSLTGPVVYLQNAYIPRVCYPSERSNVITLKVGNVAGGTTTPIALVRMCDGYLETIYLSRKPESQCVRMFNEQLKDGDSYTLEVRQSSPEVSYRDPRTNKILPRDAFEVLFY